MKILPIFTEALRHFGYTEEEARFLYLVATHSGYFTCQQFLKFIQAKPGKRSMAFARKVTEKKHASSKERSEEHTSELQSQSNLVCRLLLEKQKYTFKFQSQTQNASRLLLVTTKYFMPAPAAASAQRFWSYRSGSKCRK